MRQVILETRSLDQRAAVLKNGIPEAFFLNTLEQANQVSDIFLAIVDKKMPEIDGLFVSLPHGEKGFLPKSECPDRESSPSFFDRIKVGEHLLLQMKRGALSDKKALMTRNIQIKGDALIYLPFGDYVAASHRLSEEQREALKKDTCSFVQSPEGLIIRSKAVNQSMASLFEEVKDLKRQWESIKKKASSSIAPSRLTTHRSFSEELNAMLPSHFKKEWWTNDEDEMNTLLSQGEESHLKRTRTLFEDFGLNQAWDLLGRSTVYLKSGLTLVIEPTEALTAIDVNTGTYKGCSTKEETAFKANLEAVEEIARQLSLRQIGGIILIDLLKMNDPVHREQVQQRFVDVLKEDFVTTHVAGYTHFGLMELTRKRTSYSLFHSFRKELLD